MAIYSGTNVVNAVSGSASIDTVVLSEPGYSVKVTNLSGAAPLWWTVDSVGGACTPPTVGGHTSFLCASVAGNAVNTRVGDFQYGTVVQVISSAPTQYMVEMQSVRATS